MKINDMHFLRSNFFRKNPDCVLLVTIIATLAILASLFVYGNKLNNPPIRSDGFTYYAYLPTVIIDHNLSFRLAKDNTYKGVSLSTYNLGIYRPTGRMLNIVPPGTALLEVPFFLLADIFVILTGGVRSGYSQPYQLAMVISGIFYLVVGSLLLYVTLRRLFNKQAALLATYTVVFATNLFHYGTYDNSFSHVYSFATIAAFLYLIFRLRDLGKKSRYQYWLLIAIGMIIGLIGMIRITDILVSVLLLPILLHRKRPWKAIILDLIVVGTATFIIFLPYLLYLIHTTGSIFTNSYTIFPINPAQYPGYHLAAGNYGGFTNLSHPELINFLFSVRKGLFFWAPVVLLAFVSLAPLIKKMKALGWTVTGVLFLQIYLCASWWAWAFGGSFGSRPFVNMMPLLGLALAAGIAWVQKYVSLTLLWLTFAIFAFVNICLMYSYWRGYIWVDEMSLRLLRTVPRNLINGLR